MFQDATASRTSSAPCPTTITIFEGRAARTVCSTCQSNGRPATGCSTLGTDDRNRLPFPAARITAARERGLVVFSAKRASWVERTPIVPDAGRRDKRIGESGARPGTRCRS